jgi:hypothetical protein
VRALLAACAFVAALASCHAAAQDDADPRARARELFERGTEAHRSRRFTEAITDLRASLSLYAHPGTAFNLANALRGAGRTSEAAEVFDALLDGRYGALSETELTEARALREATRSELATLRVSVRGPDAAEIRIDGNRVEDVEGGEQSYLVDAGGHVVDARAEGFRPSDVRVEVASGEARDVALSLDAIATRSSADPSDEGATLWAKPWLWIALGVLVAGAAALTIGLVVANDNASGPFVDDELGVTGTLRIGP